MAAKRLRFIERRKALGYSQETLAEAVGVDRSTTARWERGEVEPLAYIRPKLARVLEVSTKELAVLLRTPPPTPAAASLPPLYETETGDDDMNRRELLQLLSTAGALVAVPQLDGESERRLVPETIAEYEQMNTHLWQAFSLSQSKRAVYPLVRQQLRLLTAELERSHNQATHQRLCLLAGDLFQLAGEIHFDANRHLDAGYCYSLAASASKEAEAYDLWVCALTRQAFVGMAEQRFAQTVPLLSAAETVAKRGDSQLSTRFWVAQVQAAALAGLGDFQGCARALDTAEAVTGLSADMHNGGWLRFDGSRLAEERGSCYIALGRPDLAETALTEALTRKSSGRRRGSVLTDLALLGVQRRDVGQVVQYGSQALELAEATASGYVGRKLQSLQDKLEPLAGNSQIRHLRDSIAASGVLAS